MRSVLRGDRNGEVELQRPVGAQHAFTGARPGFAGGALVLVPLVAAPEDEPRVGHRTVREVCGRAPQRPSRNRAVHRRPEEVLGAYQRAELGPVAVAWLDVDLEAGRLEVCDLDHRLREHRLRVRLESSRRSR